MKKRICALAALMIAAVMLMTGCGSKYYIDGTQTAIEFDDQKITLGEFNFIFRYQQAQLQGYMGTDYGSDNVYSEPWSDDSGLYSTYGEYCRANLVESMESLYVLAAEAPNYGIVLSDEQKQAISDTAAEFIKVNTKDAVRSIGCTQADLENYLTAYTLSAYVEAAIKAEAPIDVSNEAAAQKLATYFVVRKNIKEEDGTVRSDLTDDEIKEIKQRVVEIVEKAEETGDLEAVAEEYGLTLTQTPFGNGVSLIMDELTGYADALENVGDLTAIAESETGFYVARLDSLYDQDATDTRKGSLENEQRVAYLEEKIEELSAQHSYVPVQEVLDQLTFERAYITPFFNYY